MKGKVLVVDDEASILQSVSDILNDEGVEAATASSGEEAIAILKRDDSFKAVLADIWMDGLNGLDLLTWIKGVFADLPVIIMSGHGNIESAVKATKLGAYDFIEKPPSYDKIILTVSHAMRQSALLSENQILKNRQKKVIHETPIIGSSRVIQEVCRQISIVAPSDGRVLIAGENGTGKELVARNIHLNSLRKNKPFIEVNCAAIPEELIESELFGHEKGSFTGAVNKKIGKFDQANEGTLFLDEIGDMSLKTQAKILRVLQEQRFERLGGQEMIFVDVRVIAASNKNLRQEIKLGNFREDLYYRLNVIPIKVPSLKERIQDIPELVDFFLHNYSGNYLYPQKIISQGALEVMQKYTWPGNVRELRNIVERMMIMVADKNIVAGDVPPSVSGATRFTSAITEEYSGNLKNARDTFEKRFITAKLDKNNWNIKKTAEEIEVERSNLHKKIKQFNILPPKMV